MINLIHEIGCRYKGRRGRIVIAIAALTASIISVAVYFSVMNFGTTQPFSADLQSVVPASMLSRLTVISRMGLRMTVPLKHDSLHAIRPADRAKLRKAGAWRYQEHALFFVGAGFCPYCAAMRWPVVLTLLRFGQLSHLTLTRSGAYDVDPNTPTFGFHRVDFTASGNSLVFRHLELLNRQHQLDERPTTAENALITRLDRPPYTRFSGGIPIIVIGDRMVQLGAPVSPSLFKGMDWRQITAVLSSGHGPLWTSVMSETDDLTKAVCAVTGKRPSWVCKSPAVE